uniref:Transposase Tnp1/En/Spm-like domain-containing protein n=1 Tax=Oryza punctata TaxID=4537 RepID=A0A0E0JZC4_ORYPU
MSTPPPICAGRRPLHLCLPSDQQPRAAELPTVAEGHVAMPVPDTARSRRRCIVQSNEEYLLEEHIGEENTPQQLATPSEQETICSDMFKRAMKILMRSNEDNDDDVGMNAGEGNEESGDDVEIHVQDETGTIGTRGKTNLKDIWNLPKGLRIVVQCNDVNQAVGEEAGILTKFLGMIVRNGTLCSLSYTDWRFLIGKREKNTNELKVKKDILKQVKMRFLYSPRMEEFILKPIRERWRGHKANLKEMYFDVNKSKEANCNNVPTGVLPDQWIALINHWMSEKSKRQKDPTKKNPRREVLYIHTHKRKTGKNINGHVDNLKKLVAEQPALADTTEGRTAWKADALNQILGDDKPGHSEDVVVVRLRLEKFENHVQNHDAELLELKEKTNKLEKDQMNQKNRNKNVVVATIISSDPIRKFGGVEPGTEYLMVHVDFPLARSEELIWP